MGWGCVLLGYSPKATGRSYQSHVKVKLAKYNFYYIQPSLNLKGPLLDLARSPFGKCALSVCRQ